MPKEVAAYPGAALFKLIVSWAFEKGWMPSRAWAAYERNPRDFTIIAAYSRYQEKAQKKEMAEARDKAGVR